MQYSAPFGTLFLRSLKRTTFVLKPGAATRTSTVWLARKDFLPLIDFALSTFIVLLRERLMVIFLNLQRGLPEHVSVTVEPIGRVRTTSCLIERIECRA